MDSLKKIVIATANSHKLREIEQILSGIPARILSLKDYPEIPPIIESGESFRENAWIKAKTVHHHSGLLSLADDSGLEVDALDGAPGIYSARFAGPEKNYSENNIKLLTVLKNTPIERRGAQFRCVVSIIGPDIEKFAEGIVRGKIIGALRGSAGFGYDPLFVPDGYEQTFAELGDVLKNQISHRARAFQAAREIVEKYL
jgi:XTP/dITP diphosphohydrolase